MDAQDIANRLGAGIRNTETALANGDTAGAQTAIAGAHEAASDAFAYLRDELGLDLDWDQVVGNSEATKGAHTDGGVGKNEPD